MFFEELEFKYKADDIKLSDFKSLIKTFPVVKSMQAASWDVYYIQNGDVNSFQRLRKDKDRPELTKKEKCNDANNWIRIESDLPLDPKRYSEDQVTFHVALDGYYENFRIYKICELFFEEYLNFVYYVVFNEEFKEIGRFIEVEVNKEKVSYLEQQPGKAHGIIRDGELRLASLGITAQNRLKKSLFELYRKGA